MLMVPQDAVNVAAALPANCCVAFSATVGFSGAIVNGPAVPTVSVAVAWATGPEVVVAVIVQTLPTEAEAVNKPPELMVPHEADQVTG